MVAVLITIVRNSGKGTTGQQPVHHQESGISASLNEHEYTKFLELSGFFDQMIILSDNSTAVAYLQNQGGTRVAQNMEMAWLILTYAVQN